VHRAAITRLLQRQSMPDLETMRGLSRALGIPVREVLIRSGKLTEEDLPQAPAPPARPAPAAGPRLSAAQAAVALGIPENLSATFVQITEQFRVGTPETAPEPGADGQASP
jgi:transcriptional regulator with XRE-family HTH domain